MRKLRCYANTEVTHEKQSGCHEVRKYSIGAGEELARYITQKSHFRPSDNTVKHSAFMPPHTGRLSVYLVTGISEKKIWEIGQEYVAKVLRKQLLGRADLNSLRLYENKLKVEQTGKPHKLHCDVIGWDLSSTETRLIAVKLADAAKLKLVPAGI
jgi:hypothetical protein